MKKKLCYHCETVIPTGEARKLATAEFEREIAENEEAVAAWQKYFRAPVSDKRRILVGLFCALVTYFAIAWGGIYYYDADDQFTIKLIVGFVGAIIGVLVGGLIIRHYSGINAKAEKTAKSRFCLHDRKSAEILGYVGRRYCRDAQTQGNIGQNAE